MAIAEVAALQFL